MHRQQERALLRPPAMSGDLLRLWPSALIDASVFRSRKGGATLDTSQVLRIVQAAARRAGLEAHVSPH